MDAGAFLSMDSLHRPAAQITGRPQVSESECVCLCEGVGTDIGVI